MSIQETQEQRIVENDDSDLDQQGIIDSWKFFFEENVENGKEYFITQNLFSPDCFHFSDGKIKCRNKEALEYIELLHKENPYDSAISFNNFKYTLIRKILNKQEDEFPLFFFLSTDEIIPEDGERLILIIKFITDEVIFIGKCAKTLQAKALKFTKNTYKYEEDEE